MFFSYGRELLQNKKGTLVAMVIFGFFAVVLLTNPRLFGGARASQSKIPDSQVQATQEYKSTKNYYLGFAQAAWEQYQKVFSYRFLFVSGDANPKLSVERFGEFYFLDLPFIVLGLIFLLKKKSRISLLLLAWLIFSPIPSAVTSEAPHAHRAMYLMGVMPLIISLGVGELILYIPKLNLRILGGIVYIALTAYFASQFLNYYFTQYSKDYSVQWQYGYKQVVEYVKAHPEYDLVYMTHVRAQPYIFFLYYLGYPLGDFRESVVYNTHGSEGESMVDSFGKFHFNDWDPLDCPVSTRILCAVTINEFGGQHNPKAFQIKDLVRYPGGDPAFYLISAK